MKIFRGYTKCLVSLIIALSISSVVSLPITQAAVGQVNLAGAVPIFTGFDPQTTIKFQKEVTLDSLAKNFAKRVLHSMSLDIVDWINSGFNGNPAFLSNPGGFFLDAVDQVTGKFIFEGGLTGLCSPFEIDLKAALYLNQAGYDTRYTCTLGQVINNVQNIPNNIYVNGSNINGFIGGDFRQGGWPAFIALTTEPQNNPTGAYLKAKSELAARIADKKATINVDLNRSGGFLSFQRCDEVKTVMNPDENPQEMETAQQLALNDDSITTKINEDGSLTYERCETETPGSVVAGSLNKSLGAGQDELIAADDINSMINALITTLARTVLTGGLKGFSSNDGSNGNYSSTRYRQMIESDYQANNSSAMINTQLDVPAQLDQIKEAKSYYDQSVEIIASSRNKYLEARSCFEERLNGTRSQSAGASLQIYIINNTITKEVDPLLASLQKKKSTIDSIYNTVMQHQTTPTSGTDNLNQLQKDAQDIAIQYATLASVSQSTVDTAQSDWQKASTEGNKFMSEATQMLTNCQN